MGVCWGAPHYPTPSFSGYLRPGQPQLTISSSSSDDEDGLGKFGGVNGPNSAIPVNPRLRIFTFDELKRATRNFRSDTLLGEGGFGRVYKGRLDEDSASSNGEGRVEIAIKKLNPQSVQGFREWKSEITVLGSLHHPNIVRLFGYCRVEDDTMLLLVYEYIPKGSLKRHLYRRNSNNRVLSWEMRLKIALGSAKGLAYLHKVPIIYRDFKSSNILLDESYNAKISDFGLARSGPIGDETYVTTRVVGTYGYAAPEYLATGHLYLKSDVYSFGVVLLEMLAGQRAFDENRPQGQKNLVDWFKPNLSRRKLARVMDPRLEGKYPLKGALQVAELAVQCLHPEPQNRPSMAEVVESLEKIAAP